MRSLMSLLFAGALSASLANCVPPPVVNGQQYIPSAGYYPSSVAHSPQDGPSFSQSPPVTGVYVTPFGHPIMGTLPVSNMYAGSQFDPNMAGVVSGNAAMRSQITATAAGMSPSAPAGTAGQNTATTGSTNVNGQISALSAQARYDNQRILRLQHNAGLNNPPAQ